MDAEQKRKENEKNKEKATAYDKEKGEFLNILQNYNINNKFPSIEDTGDNQSARLIQNLISKGFQGNKTSSNINDIARSILIIRLPTANKCYETTK
jgi:uncharacterized protein involved in exopolysaccharide biosynthesis